MVRRATACGLGGDTPPKESPSAFSLEARYSEGSLPSVLQYGIDVYIYGYLFFFKNKQV